MPARARRLTRAGSPVDDRRCGQCSVVSRCSRRVEHFPGRSHPPSRTPTVVTIPTPSPTPQIVGTTRTVLSPLGPADSLDAGARVLETSSAVSRRGGQFTVLQYQSGGGGWYPRAGADARRMDRRRPDTHRGRHVQHVRRGGRRSPPSIRRTGVSRTSRSGRSLFRSREPGRASCSSSPTASRRSAPPACPGTRNPARHRLLVCGYTGDAELLHEKCIVHRRDTAAAAGRAATAVRGDPLQDRFVARDADRFQLSEQQPARRVRGAVQLRLAFPFPLCEAPAAITTPKP